MLEQMGLGRHLFLMDDIVGLDPTHSCPAVSTAPKFDFFQGDFLQTSDHDLLSDLATYQLVESLAFRSGSQSRNP